MPSVFATRSVNNAPKDAMIQASTIWWMQTKGAAK
jgi:hypothetical protein